MKKIAELYRTIKKLAGAGSAQLGKPEALFNEI